MKRPREQYSKADFLLTFFGMDIMYRFTANLSRGVYLFMPILLIAVNAHAFTTEASFYTRASCIKESGQCVMANGKELQDEGQYTCASWDYKFGQLLKLKRNGREVVVSVTDRGPAKRLYRKGRKIDVNLATAKALNLVKVGIAQVEVEEVNHE